MRDKAAEARAGLALRQREDMDAVRAEPKAVLAQDGGGEEVPMASAITLSSAAIDVEVLGSDVARIEAMAYAAGMSNMFANIEDEQVVAYMLTIADLARRLQGKAEQLAERLAVAHRATLVTTGEGAT